MSHIFHLCLSLSQCQYIELFILSLEELEIQGKLTNRSLKSDPCFLRC